jgi:hypothetical protein
MNTGKTIGLILVAVGVGVCLLSALWLGVGFASGNYDNLAAPILGLGLAFVVAAPLVGVGVFLFVKGQREAVEFAEVEKERKLLGMVQAQGQVGISDVALYSRDASQLRGDKCPNCGGEVELAGKGVVRCPYCGAEIFLTE